MKHSKYAVPNADIFMRCARTLFIPPWALHGGSCAALPPCQLYVPARKLPEMYGVAHSSIQRTDREVPSTKLPHPQLNGIEGILVDEKYLGPSHGFVTLVPNARTGEPLHMARGRDGKALESFFNLLADRQKRSIRFRASTAQTPTGPQPSSISRMWRFATMPSTW